MEGGELLGPHWMYLQHVPVACTTGMLAAIQDPRKSYVKCFHMW